MKSFSFKKIDAFTGGDAAGNPAGCIFLKSEADISVDSMQKIARELKGFVNEVAFLFPAEDGFRLKFYSSECEVEFCGHATIAVMHDLIREDAALWDKQEFTLYVNAGRLSVFNHVREEDAVYVMAPEPQFLPCRLAPAEIARALALKPALMNDGAPVQIINAGLRTLIVPLVSLDVCLGTWPTQETLREFCLAAGVDIVLVYTPETYLDFCQYRTRVFAPKFGYLEDPATGSGNSAFGYYLLQNNLWTANLSIEQGMSKTNPNIVKLRRLSQGANARILFGGSSKTRIMGNYLLHG